MDELQEMMGGRGQFRVRASKGIHLVVPRNRINSRTGVITRTEKSLLFIIPWGDRWIIGTTDTDWTLDRAHPAASSADIDYLLGHANRLLADPLDRDDVVGVYAGLRPLLAGESDSTSKLSREHAVASPVRGRGHGGRREVHHLPGDGQGRGRRRGRRPGPAGARVLHRGRPAARRRGLPGAVEHPGPDRRGDRADPVQVEHLLNRYGSLLPELRALLAEQPALAAPLDSAPGYLQVEAVYAAAYEGALHLDDILARRTRISIETWDRGVAAATEVAAWSPRCSAGARRRWPGRSSTTRSGWRPSASRSTSPTTSRPTPPGSAPPTYGWDGLA